jgi:hypothetical protein
MMDNKDDEDLLEPIEEQRARVEMILSTDKGKPKTILKIPPGEYTDNNLYEAVYRQLVFIYSLNFKPSSDKNDKILEMANKAVNSK